MPLSIALEPPLRADAAGVVRVGATRVLVELIVTAFRAGSTPEEIVIKFPTLGLANVYSTVAYYLRNMQQLDAYVAERDAQAAANRARAETIEPMSAVRARLLARERLAS